MQNSSATPIVVDLDGTLTPTDTLIESFVLLLKQSPLNVLRALVWLLRGRAHFKEAVAARATVSAERIPYRKALVDYLRVEKGKGRRLVLATAAHESIARGVFEHLGFFDDVLASCQGNNLKGKAKLDAIVRTVGKEFVYAGDCRADLPIWRAASAAILVGVSPRLATTVRTMVAVECEFPREAVVAADWLRALRVHQWLKNLLLFVPIMTAFSFAEAGKLMSLSVAFLAFSLLASASYMVNDLLDIESDRVHPRKRLRPFASARIPILWGLSVAAGCLFASLLLAFSVSGAFLLMIVTYLLLTSAYSWILKAYVVVDVLMLSMLYTVRILAGSVASGVPTSSWLLAFSAFLFLSLALIKRCAELITLAESGAQGTVGRDYRVSDLAVLWPLGVGAALSSVVVFGLFISVAETQQRYASPQLLWGVALGLFYWLGRLWIKTSRGEMHDDPVVFAIKDRTSRLTVAAMLGLMLVAHFFALSR